MTDMILRTIEGEWDRTRNLLWWRLKFANGRLISVGIPLSRVACTFYEELQAPDVQEEISACAMFGQVEIMGDVDIIAPESIDGFLSGITRALKKATAPIGRAIKRTTRKLKKVAWRAAKTVTSPVRYAAKYGLKYGRKLASSKLLGQGLGALSLAMPAVGGPALAAWAVANRVNRHLKTAERAMRQVRRTPQRQVRRVLNPSQHMAVLRAQSYARRARHLASMNTPASRMLVAGLRSVR